MEGKKGTFYFLSIYAFYLKREIKSLLKKRKRKKGFFSLKSKRKPKVLA